MPDPAVDLSTDRDRELRRIIALLYVGPGFAEECIAWAVQELVRGVETPTLASLAGLSSHTPVREVQPHFEAVLSELGVALPSPDRALWDRARDLAEAMLTRSSSADAGASELYRIWEELDHPDALQPFLYVCDDLDPRDYADLDSAAFERVARREAATFLDRLDADRVTTVRR